MNPPTLTPRETWETLRDLKHAAQVAWQEASRREYIAWLAVKAAEDGDVP